MPQTCLMDNPIAQLQQQVEIHEHAIARLQEAHAQNHRRIVYAERLLLGAASAIAVALASIKYENGSLSYAFSVENVRVFLELFVAVGAALGLGTFVVKRIKQEE